jgi:hypothetical protein
MTNLELCSRNVSAALREALNAQTTFMVHCGLAFPIDWKRLKKKYPLNERLLRDLTAAVEYLATAQLALKDRNHGLPT